MYVNVSLKVQLHVPEFKHAPSYNRLSCHFFLHLSRYTYFEFEHSPSYQEVQFLFLDAVESLNPNNISVSYEILSQFFLSVLL